MKDRQYAAIYTGSAAREKNKTWAFPGSGDRYTVQENGSVINPDRINKPNKAQKRAMKRVRIVRIADRHAAEANLAPAPIRPELQKVLDEVKQAINPQ